MKLEDVNLRHLLYTRRFMAIAVAFALMSVVLIIVGIVPQINQILEIQGDLTKERAKLQQLQRKATALQQAETLSLVEQAELIDSALPSKKPLLEFLTAVDDAARLNQVNVVDIQISPGKISTESAEVDANTRGVRNTKKKVSSYEELDLALIVLGDLQNVNGFLSTMESTVPLTNVTRISLNEKTRGNTEGEQFEAETILTTYYFTQSIKAAVEAPLPDLSPDTQAFLEEVQRFRQPSLNAQDRVIGGGLDDLFGLDVESE